jgi:hypothetical protein
MAELNVTLANPGSDTLGTYAKHIGNLTKKLPLRGGSSPIAADWSVLTQSWPDLFIY